MLYVHLLSNTHTKFEAQFIKMLSNTEAKLIKGVPYKKSVYLSKMKELDQIVLQKGLLASIKGHFCLTKRHLTIQKGRWRFNSPNQKLFLISFIYINKKNFFSKRALLTKRPISRCFIFTKDKLASYFRVTFFIASHF